MLRELPGNFASSAFHREFSKYTICDTPLSSRRLLPLHFDRFAPRSDADESSNSVGRLLRKLATARRWVAITGPPANPLSERTHWNVRGAFTNRATGFPRPSYINSEYYRPKQKEREDGVSSAGKNCSIFRLSSPHERPPRPFVPCKGVINV